ncbi:PAS domain-containing protein [Sphingomonas sp. S2-65]|uniref:PAS domain-containing sensor histidine kinase n=1 Tax=Sphingomonas sp. S2-65 TaxID=2903960 RepID=UPI001F3482AE|nr:PAS domain-containing protein [Sphingomonas sp. S2-65]UYY57517.1 PAS domain-containing protein [Sphingomonas sp. S2-65]
MSHAGASSRDQGPQWLLDENEQLRTSLESALDENSRQAEEIERLMRTMTVLSSELRTGRAVQASAERQAAGAMMAGERQSETEEELRVALEELQVLTEELEVANSGLHRINRGLDARVEERTRRITEVNAVLRTTEASFRTIADLVPDLLWRTDARGRATWFNERWAHHTGQRGDEPLDLGWLQAVHPDDRVGAKAEWERAVAGGGSFQREFRIKGADARYRWFLIRAEAMRDGGRIVNWFVAGTDIDDQRTALEALQQSELRFRTLVEGMPQLVWRAVDGGHWTWSSLQWTAYTGQSEADSHGMGWLAMFHPDDRGKALAAWGCAASRGSLELEGRIHHALDARYRHFRTRALPVQKVEGQPTEWIGTSTDVDDILQLQHQQDVLVTELQHRTRNLMAVVQAVTLRTLKGSATLADFRACIDDRLQALARVQSLLSQRDGGLKVTFDTLLRQELSAHVDLDGDGKAEHVTIRGPAGVPLRSTIVQTLALALHELATNAVKYGALSAPDGHLNVEWNVREEADARKLWVDWRESGVADMPAPGSKPRGGGYGRELIERALPYQLGARTSYAFEPDGVHCTIEVTVPEESEWRKTDG